MTAELIHVLAGDRPHVEAAIEQRRPVIALCGASWVPKVADPDGPVCSACVRALIFEVDLRNAAVASRDADLAAARAERDNLADAYQLLTEFAEGLTERGNNALSERNEQRLRADRTEAKIAEALAWCDQYESPVDGGVADSPIDRLMFEERCRTAKHVAMQVRAALATTGEPLDTTVKACIAEKTEHDRGRG